MPEPLVTLVITPRESHFLSERSLLSVLADDSAPFALIYVDIASPPDVAQAIQALAAARGFRLIRHDDWIAPAAARKQALAEVATKYAACIDNDVLVEPGCLKALIDCAEETGAGLVCPLYIQAGGGRPSTIHMAGGLFVWEDDEKTRLIGERHRLAAAPVEAAAGLPRAPADFTEYHYVLGRMDFLGRPEAVSDDVLLVHEHLDLALVARQQGLTVMVEPAARATYVAFEPRALRDLAFYRRRWGKAECARSVHAFADKWLGENRRELVDRTLVYIEGRLQEVELRRRGSAGQDLDRPMSRAELAQNRTELREQALARGYSARELRQIDEAADFATVLYDGLYRPDGRPFLSHGIGTASAMVRYELDAELVEAGLLHAAFNVRPDWMPEAELATAMARKPRVDRAIRHQDEARAFLGRHDADLMALNVLGSGVAALLAANETDMRLSGEYRATGRPTDLAATALERIGVVLGFFDVAGLAISACAPVGQVQAWPVLGGEPRLASFRIDSGRQRALASPTA